MNKDDIDFERLQIEIRNKLAQEHNWQKQEEQWQSQRGYWIAAVIFAGIALMLNFFKGSI